MAQTNQMKQPELTAEAVEKAAPATVLNEKELRAFNRQQQKMLLHSPRNGRVLYAWEPTDKKPVRDGKGELMLDIHGKTLEEQLPFGQFLKKFTHTPGSIILGAPKRGGFYATIEPKNRRQ